MEKNAVACPVPRDPYRTSERSKKPLRRSQAEIDIDSAVERVYRIYGPNLTAFFDAVYKQQQLERLRSESVSNNSFHPVR